MDDKAMQDATQKKHNEVLRAKLTELKVHPSKHDCCILVTNTWKVLSEGESRYSVRACELQLAHRHCWHVRARQSVRDASKTQSEAAPMEIGLTLSPGFEQWQ